MAAEREIPSEVQLLPIVVPEQRRDRTGRRGDDGRRRRGAMVEHSTGVVNDQGGQVTIDVEVLELDLHVLQSIAIVESQEIRRTRRLRFVHLRPIRGENSARALPEGFDRLITFRSGDVLIRFALADEIQFGQGRGEFVLRVETFPPEENGLVHEQSLFFRRDFGVVRGEKVQQQTRTSRIDVQGHRVLSAEVGDVTRIGAIDRQVSGEKVSRAKTRDETTQLPRVESAVVEFQQIHRAVVRVRRFEEEQITETNVDTFAGQSNKGVITELPLAASAVQTFVSASRELTGRYVPG